MRIENTGIVWGLIYVNRGCLRHLGAQLCESRLVGEWLHELRILASFEGSYMRTGGVCASGNIKLLGSFSLSIIVEAGHQ